MCSQRQREYQFARHTLPISSRGSNKSVTFGYVAFGYGWPAFSPVNCFTCRLTAART